LIKISHKEIANDLGTAREVVSRIVKKMERENILKLHHESLELL
jgi:CRP/FNR family transcriptional regulator